MSVEKVFRGCRVDSLARTPPVRIPSGAPLFEAVRRMREARRGACLILRDGKLAGVFTERDYLNRVLAIGADPSAPVDAYMTSPVRTLPDTATMGRAIRLMVSERLRHVPLVSASGEVVAVLRVQDVLRYLVERFPKDVLNLPPRSHQTMVSPEGA